MNGLAWTAFHNPGVGFTTSRHAPAAASPASGSPSAWGVMCGVGFLATRAAVYLVAILLAALGGVLGMVLYGVHALIGGRHA